MIRYHSEECKLSFPEGFFGEKFDRNIFEEDWDDKIHRYRAIYNGEILFTYKDLYGDNLEDKVNFEGAYLLWRTYLKIIIG